MLPSQGREASSILVSRSKKEDVYMFDFAAFFSEHFVLVRAVHLIGVIVGLGAATVSDITFLSYLKDRRLEKKEIETLRLFSKIIWFALFFIAVGGIAMFLSNPAKYLDSPRFLTKMTIVLVIIANGFFLNLGISPRLRSIFRDISLRRVAFASGAISAASWYSAFVFSTVMRMFSFSYSQFIFIYICVLAAALMASQIFALHFGKGIDDR